MSSPIVQFANVSKSFGPKKVLNGLSFDIHAGEFLVLLGPNGAGKSTTISLATGLGRADAGDVRIFGHPAGSFAAKQKAAFVPQEPSFPAHVTARQILKFMAAHYESAGDLNHLAKELEMASFLDLPVRHLSGGQKRLVSIASAFVAQVPFVILDEPTAGLDWEARRKVWKFLARFTAQGGSILMTTHYLIEAEELADRIVVLAGGKVVRSGCPEEIKRQFGFKRIRFRASQAPPSQWGAAKATAHEWMIDSRSADATLKEVVEWGEASEIEVSPLALEDVFEHLIEGEK